MIGYADLDGDAGRALVIPDTEDEEVDTGRRRLGKLHAARSQLSELGEPIREMRHVG